MNSDLKDSVFEVPQEIINSIQVVVNQLGDQHANGKERAMNIIRDGKVTYPQLKTIIHDIGSLNKEQDALRYQLMGGDLMAKWAHSFLNSQRKHIKNKKDITKRNNEISGLDGTRRNGHIVNHEKKTNYDVDPNGMKNKSEKSSISSLTSSLKLFEEINKIKKLM